jgi:hypothetical protein
MRFSIIFTSMALAFLSCKGLAITEDDTNYDILQNQVLKATEKELGQEFGFTVVSFGGGFAGALKKLTLYGEVAPPYTIEKARRTMVSATELFLKNINQMKPLRPNMDVFPFPIKGIELSFYVTKEAITGTDELTSFGLYRGKISYNTRNPETKKLQTILCESFEEAKKNLEKENGSVQAHLNTQKYDLTYDASSELEESFKHGWKKSKNELYLGPPIEESMLWSLDNFCTDLGYSNNLNFIQVGDFTNAHKYFYGLSFFGHQKYTLKECRVATIDLFDKIFAFLRATPEVLRFQAWEKKHKPLFSLDELPSLNDICFRITYWDKNFDHWEPPYISQVLFADNKFQYFEADANTQELRLVFEESYEEAMSGKNKQEKVALQSTPSGRAISS